MKTLVAITCCVVIAAAGYYLVGEYRAAAAATKTAAFDAWLSKCYSTIDQISEDFAAHKTLASDFEPVLVDCAWRGGPAMRNLMNQRFAAVGMQTNF